MKIFKNEINGVKFTIVCEVWQTKNAWGHVAKLLENDVEIGFYKLSFISLPVVENYRLIIQCLINEVKKRAEKAVINVFLNAKGYKRMTANRFFALTPFLQNDKKYMLYNELFKIYNF